MQADKHRGLEKEESGMLPGSRKEGGAIAGSRRGSRKIWVLRKWSGVTEMLGGHPVRRVKKLPGNHEPRAADPRGMREEKKAKLPGGHGSLHSCWKNENCRSGLTEQFSVRGTGLLGFQEYGEKEKKPESEAAEGDFNWDSVVAKAGHCSPQKTDLVFQYNWEQRRMLSQVPAHPKLDLETPV